jgi:multiple sugar transport system permease protein
VTNVVDRSAPSVTGAASAAWRHMAFPYLLIAPSVVLLLALTVFPLFFALKNSFYFWNLQMSPQPLGFIGFGNYEMALSTSVFTASLVNTIVLTLSGTTLEVLFGLAIALLLCRSLPGMNAVRAILIMPTTIAPIVVGFLFRYMYDPTGGIIPWLLSTVGIPIPREGLLGSGHTALASVLFADLWQWTPFCAIVLYAALLSVPTDVIEAARLDGASAWTILLRMRIPLIRKTIAFVAMLRFMQIFNTFDLVLVLTRGGPGSSSRTLGYTLYQQGLVDFNIGLASAMTWLIVIMVNALIGLYVFFIFRDWE